MKVAIAGAGPAGLAAAIFLAEAGAEVVVYEAFSVGENIVCAEGFFDFHGNLKLNLPFSMKINKIIVVDKEEFCVNLPSSSSFFTFDRKTWQKNLKDTAASKGATFVENHKLTKEDIIELSENNDYVIDATGIKAISHFLFPRKDVIKYRKGFMPTFQHVISGDFSNYEGCIKAIILNNPAGYFWLFPKRLNGSLSIANAGLGYLAKNKKIPNLKNTLEKILEKEGLSSCTVLTKKASPIPTNRIKTFITGNIILTGDALGLCSPLHGGGIDSAYLSGIYAAKSIIHRDFSIYQRFLNQLSKRFFKERLIVKLWSLLGSTKVLMRLKDKGLFEDRPENIPFSNDWLKKAILSMLFHF